ncbi:MAG TPA: heat-inducible transcription repressor HrcA [Firmicutes bacterium]|nr:heat-inducible transcription repressor HrcA [Candidatus Fermentithermobacillaceae bacterium]
MILDERKAQILRAIVEDHVRTGLPVGSRAVARRYKLGISPATIRNEMADLEEMGYLDKPHTSSGRVPSDKGYRFYVDQLLPETGITPEESLFVESLFRSKIRDVVSLLKEVVRAVSEATSYLAFILGPDYETTTFKAIHLLPASFGKALVVIVSDAGFVESCLIDVPPMSREEMEYVSDMLFREICNVSLDKVTDRAHELLHKETSRYAEIIAQVIEFLRNMSSETETERLYMGGTANLLSQPEFRDINKVQDLLLAIENGSLIQNIISRRNRESDPAITIGQENETEVGRDLSIVYGVFKAGKSEGRIGLLGPKRMNYARAVAIVKLCEEKLNEFFSWDE